MKENDDIYIWIGDIVQCNKVTPLAQEEYKAYVAQERQRLIEEEHIDEIDAWFIAQQRLAEQQYITTGIQVATYVGPVKYDIDVIERDVVVIRYKNKLINYSKVLETNLVEEMDLPFLYPGGNPNPLPGYQYFDDKQGIFLRKEIEGKKLNGQKAEAKLFELTGCSSYEEATTKILKNIRKAKGMSLLKKFCPHQER